MNDKSKYVKFLIEIPTVFLNPKSFWHCSFIDLVESEYANSTSGFYQCDVVVRFLRPIK
jgi:hypothetical protein